MAVKIEIWLVNGDSYPDYSISEHEFTTRIIGDDWGPPVSAWRFSIERDDGQILTVTVDPTDTDANALEITFPAGIEGDEDLRRDWIVSAIDTAAAKIEDLLRSLDPVRCQAVRERLSQI